MKVTLHQRHAAASSGADDAGTMLMRAILTALSTAVAGCVATPNVEPSTGGNASPAMWVSGPHWRGSIVNELVESHGCRSVEALTATFGFADAPIGQLWNRRRLLRSLSYSGGAASAQTIRDVNAAIMSFESSPSFSLQCFGGRVRVHLYMPAQGPEERELFFEIVP